MFAEHYNPFVNNSLVSVVFHALGLFPSAVQRGIVALHQEVPEDVLYSQRLFENYTILPFQEIPGL